MPYSCTDNVCVEDEDGIFPTLEECESFCQFPNPIPVGCADYVDEFTLVQRRVGCSAMLAQYDDTETYEIVRKIDCSVLSEYSDEEEFEIGRVAIQPPCLCVPLPESCNPSGVVLYATITSNCAHLDGQVIELTYIGTECNHEWYGEAELGDCTFTVQVACACQFLFATFSYGTMVTCTPESVISSDYQCSPLLITLVQTGCTYTQGSTNCGTCDITITITL